MNNNTEFSPIKNLTVVETIVEQLTQAMINGNLKPGDRIPTENELSKQFHVGRTSVREAIKMLISYGVLEIRRAEGTFVCSGFSDLMLNPMIYGMILSQENSFDHLIQVRRIFEIGAYQTAAENATETELENIREKHLRLAELIRQKPADYEVVLETDEDFHTAIENSLKNPLLNKIASIIAQLIRYSRLKLIQGYFESGTEQYLVDSHKAILNALENRRPQDIPAAVDYSYTYWKTIHKK